MGDECTCGRCPVHPWPACLKNVAIQNFLAATLLGIKKRHDIEDLFALRMLSDSLGQNNEGLLSAHRLSAEMNDRYAVKETNNVP